MLNKATQKKRRAKRTRAIIRQSGKARLCVYRSLKHFYAQIILPGEKGDRIITSISTVDKEIKKNYQFSSNNMEVARQLGTLLAQRAKAAGIQQVAFDRSGNKYHGRFKKFAEAAKTAGLHI